MTMTLEAPPPARLTAVDLLTLPDDVRYELVDGALRARNMGGLSSWVGGRIHHRLADYEETTGIGRAFPADAGYQCFADDPDRVRKPDASFVSRDRLAGGVIPAGHLRVAPDVAVEVVSPNDLFQEVLAKKDEYLAAGVRLVWLLDPHTRVLLAFRPGSPPAEYRPGDELTAEDVLPGFRCAVADLFPSG